MPKLAMPLCSSPCSLLQLPRVRALTSFRSLRSSPGSPPLVGALGVVCGRAEPKVSAESKRMHQTSPATKGHNSPRPGSVEYAQPAGCPGSAPAGGSWEQTASFAPLTMRRGTRVPSPAPPPPGKHDNAKLKGEAARDTQSGAHLGVWARCFPVHAPPPHCDQGCDQGSGRVGYCSVKDIAANAHLSLRLPHHFVAKGNILCDSEPTVRNAWAQAGGMGREKSLRYWACRAV